MTQHIVLTFTVLRRGYVLYILPGESANETPDKISIDGDTPQRKVRRQYFHTGDNHLTRKEFDSWMRKHKPYLDHLYKLTDLSDALNVNRTYLSRFVNVTYGVNFNRYLNRLRLRELRRLIILPSNDGKPVKELLGQAGFYSMRQYRSILATEKENNR